MSFIEDTLQQLKRPEYSEDTLRVQSVAMDRGVTLTLQQAEDVWLRYSESMAAGWMNLPNDDEELWETIS